MAVFGGDAATAGALAGAGRFGFFETAQFEPALREREPVFERGELTVTAAPSAPGTAPTTPGAPAPQPTIWDRLGDVLVGGFAAPTVQVPEEQAQTVTFVPGQRSPLLALLLLLAAAGAGYWWYTRRRKGGS